MARTDVVFPFGDMTLVDAKSMADGALVRARDARHRHGAEEGRDGTLSEWNRIEREAERLEALSRDRARTARDQGHSLPQRLDCLLKLNALGGPPRELAAGNDVLEILRACLDRLEAGSRS